MKARILDLFCGAGGAAMGYALAGFEVVGVDIVDQPRYPFEFIKWDALDFVGMMPYSAPVPNFGFDAVHASPPCQEYSILRKLQSTDRSYADLVPRTQAALRRLGLPYVIENVPRAPLYASITLCGSMFGLTTSPEPASRINRYLNRRPKGLRRHRIFECSFPIEPPCSCDHTLEVVGVYGQARGKRTKGTGGYQGTLQERMDVMQIGWMTGPELSQAIPPAYTEYIGKELLKWMGL